MDKTRDQKLKKLLQDGRELYHTQDLAVLWGISNPNTLYTAIKRYINRGFLNKIYKGFYSTVLTNQINPLRLGLSALHRYGYVSAETILSRAGVIFQEVSYITLVSDISKKFEINGKRFLVRRMKGEYLHNMAGMLEEDGIKIASPERAVADILYFNPNYHFDAERSVDWKKVRDIQKHVGYGKVYEQVTR